MTHHKPTIEYERINKACELGYIKYNPTKNVKIGKDLVTKHVDVYSTEERLNKRKRNEQELPICRICLIDS